MRLQTTPPHSQAGLTMVELMVSMALGLMLIGTIGYAYIGANNSHRNLSALTRIQENARYAFEFMTHDIRMAGQTGCSSQSHLNVLTTQADWDKNLFDLPLIGYEDAVPTNVANYLRGDALAIISADSSTEALVSTHNAGTTTFTLTASHDFEEGDLVVATDCQHASVFEVRDESSTTIDHAATGSNSVACLGASSGGACQYQANSRIFPLRRWAYYLRTNPANEPALYRDNQDDDAEELVEGVEDMEITYGVDTDVTADNNINAYLNASQVDTVAVPGTNTAERWARVLSVRISLLMVSTANDGRVTTGSQTYTFRGAAQTKTDGRLRKVFSTTIAVRNRL